MLLRCSLVLWLLTSCAKVPLPRPPPLADPLLCGNGVVDEGEFCDQKLERPKCPEPWGLCWICSASCQSRTVFLPLGTPQPYCSLVNGGVKMERRYDLTGNVIAEWSTGGGKLLSRSAWVRDLRGRPLLIWKDGDGDARPYLEVRNTWGENGDVETVTLEGRLAWHPKAVGRSTPPAAPETGPYPPRSEYSRRVHDARGRLVSFVWQPRPGVDHVENQEYGDARCDQATRITGDDRDGNGQPDSARRFSLGPDCRIVEGGEDNDGDGVEESRLGYDYDGAGRLTRQWTTTGSEVTWELKQSWDPAGRLTRAATYMKGRLSNDTRHAFNARGQETWWWSDTDGDGKPESEHVTTWDPAGRMLSKRVANVSVVRRQWRKDGADETIEWNTGLRCTNTLDLEGRELHSACLAEGESAANDETTTTRDTRTGFPLEQRVTFHATGEVGVTTWDLTCLKDVWETMPWAR